MKTSQRRCNIHNTTTSQPCSRKFIVLSKNAKVRIFLYLYSTTLHYALRSQIYKRYCTRSDNSIRGYTAVAHCWKKRQLLLTAWQSPTSLSCLLLGDMQILSTQQLWRGTGCPELQGSVCLGTLPS